MFLSKLKNKKEVISWSLYDFANQPFTTIIVTFVYGAFFTSVIASDEKTGTLLWTSAIAITAVVVSLLSPILGALADRGGYRKFFLISFTWICAIFSILLYFPKAGDVYFALSLFIVANIAFEMGSVFCNSYLPDLSERKNIGKISGFAWGLGFVGGLIAMFLSLIFVVQPETPIFNLERLSSSNSLELKVDSISENRIYVYSTNDIHLGMYLKLENKNITEDIVVKEIKDNYLSFSKHINNLEFPTKRFELYGKPIWTLEESTGSYAIFSTQDKVFEIRSPVYSYDSLMGLCAYSNKGEIFLIDKKFCSENNLDYHEISTISHKTTQNIRFNNILIGIWFLIFSIPTFLFIKDRKSEKLQKHHITDSFKSIKNTFKEVVKYKIILQFLIARLFFNDGLITIFSLGGIYAVDTLNFTFDEVMMLGIVLNIAAGVGSFVFGYLEDLIGVRKVINISLLVLIFATLLAYFAPETTNPKQMFWVAGVLIGLMVGPNQSCSRSFMSRLTPKEKQNEFFGFFALTGKATSFLGPLLFGFITLKYSQQIALWVVIVFFIIGLFLFNRIQFKED
ncbi:MAG: MFS transporter [Flavobacteriales bacterium]|jgi:MFS-type transporter involved in bile tolerance (Atg22 family)|nr:MFS transporter [Flavobacteriales bacterium]